jgi:translation initiation factor 1
MNSLVSDNFDSHIMRQSKSGLVYSTDKEYLRNHAPKENEETASKSIDLRIRLEKNHRGGKTVTIVSGFSENETGMNELAKLLKQKCGTGGSIKENEILIQGDFRERIKEELKKLGYKAKG